VRPTGPARLLALVVTLAAAALAACGSASADGSATAPPTVSDGFPPAQAVSDAQGSWATLAMGHLADPNNTFGELVYRPGGPDCAGAAPCAPAAWSLTTPPGVATNGGLVLSADGGGSLTTGFGASLDLTYSPLAVTTDAAATWATGVLPAALVATADSLAASGPERLALVHAGGGRVLASTGDLSTWSVLTDRGAVSSAATPAGCALGRLTAVAVSARGADLVAGTCTSGGRAGIFRIGMSGATAARPSVVPVGPVVGSGVTGPLVVDRLVATPAGLSALVVAGGGTSTRLLLATSTDGAATWSVTATRDVTGPVVAASVDPTGGMVVVVGATGHRSAVAVEPGGTWRTLPALPAGTAIVVGGPGAAYSALVPSGSTLTVDVSTGGAWTRSQRLAVPISYGSSG